MKLNILGAPVDIVFSDHITEYGHWEYDRGRILINKTHTALVQKMTLGHELTHVIEEHHKLELPEKAIDFIGTGWVTLLRGNPKLVEYLTRDG